MRSSGSSLANRSYLDQRLTLESWSQDWYWPWQLFHRFHEDIKIRSQIFIHPNLVKSEEFSWILNGYAAVTVSFQSSLQAPNLTSVKRTEILDFQTTSTTILTCETQPIWSTVHRFLIFVMQVYIWRTNLWSSSWYIHVAHSVMNMLFLWPNICYEGIFF